MRQSVAIACFAGAESSVNLTATRYCSSPGAAPGRPGGIGSDRTTRTESEAGASGRFTIIGHCRPVSKGTSVRTSAPVALTFVNRPKTEPRRVSIGAVWTRAARMDIWVSCALTHEHEAYHFMQPDLPASRGDRPASTVQLRKSNAARMHF